MRKEIAALRGEMEKRGIFAYIVMTEDFHGSEYVGEYFKLREYLSGFTGSAGTLVVTPDDAALWTDGRYFIQAAAELENSGIELMKTGEPQTPELEKFIAEKLPENGVVGFDGRTVSAAFARKLKDRLKNKAAAFREIDLGEAVWKDRPPLSKQPVFELPLKYCGMTRAEKLAGIREKMQAENTDCLAVSALDEIAWTLNLRGGDVAYNPVFLSYMLVFRDRVKLFVNSGIISEGIAEKLGADGVELLPYNDIYGALRELDCAVWADPKAVNYSFYSALENSRVIEKASPVTLMKAIKTDAEIAALRNAHLKDGLAVTRFMRWIKEAVKTELVTELSAAEKLEEFRRMGKDYLGQSFEPIIAYGEHGAIVHYSATEASDAVMEPKGFVLCDTGGHYLDGTTDVTRTIALGEDCDREASTLVLAAHLELLDAVFPKGVRGSALDAAARREMWRKGIDFKHGTGHGVGFLLNVHEGPQRISWRAVNDAPIEAGMVTSNEPGMYVEGEFGIRHESLMLCRRDERFEEEFYCFEALTPVPFDRDGIDGSLLSERQRIVLNEYHRKVFGELSPYMNEEEREWLRGMTATI